MGTVRFREGDLEKSGILKFRTSKIFAKKSGEKGVCRKTPLGLLLEGRQNFISEPNPIVPYL